MSRDSVITFDISPEEFLPAYRPHIDTDDEIQLFISNSGSGKSEFNHKRAVAFALGKEYFRLVFSRRVKDTIRDSIFLGLKDVIINWNLSEYFQIREQPMDIICRLNGNMMLSFGFDDPEKLKSIKDPTHFFYDEFSESEFEDFAEARRRLRTMKIKQTQFWGCLNPVAGWWGREYFFADSKSDIIPAGIVPAKTAKTLILKTSYRDNPFIDPVAYENKNRELALVDENNWIVYDQGNWGKLQTGGEFYSAFRRSIHVKDVEFIPGLVNHLSFDFNVVPYMTLICSQIVVSKLWQIGNDKTTRFPADHESHVREISKNILGSAGVARPITVFQIRIFREYCLVDPRNTNKALCDEYISEFGQFNCDVIYYGDADGNARKRGLGNVTDYKEIRTYLRKYIDDSSDRTWRANPSVLKTREFLNKIFAGIEIAPGIYIEMIVDNTCTELIKDLENAKLSSTGMLKQMVDDKKTGQRYEKYGHAGKALNYFVTKCFDHYFKMIQKD